MSGKNWWEWVFVGTLAVLPVIRPSHEVQGRGLQAPCSARSGRWSGCPTCWATSAATQPNGRCAWRICCAMRHYAIECGDTAFSAAFQRLLLRVIAYQTTPVTS